MQCGCYSPPTDMNEVQLYDSVTIHMQAESSAGAPLFAMHFDTG